MAKKILMADDDPAVSQTLKTTLKNGYEVDAAANGEEYLQKVLINKPDLLLLDGMMPRMDGFSLCGGYQGVKGLNRKRASDADCGNYRKGQ